MVSNEEISRRLALKRKGLNPDEELDKGLGRICSKCQTANLENARFCIGCGDDLNKIRTSKPEINEIKSNLVVCPSCGSENKQGSKFCIGCGSNLVETGEIEPEKKEVESDSIICPECNVENNKGSKFCIGCGNTLNETSTNEEKNEIGQDSIICPECNFENNKGSKFCIGCGNTLKETSTEIIEDENSAEVNEEEVHLEIKDINPPEIEDKQEIQSDAGSVNSLDNEMDDNAEVKLDTESEDVFDEEDSNLELDTESETFDEKVDNGQEQPAEVNVLDEIKKAKELMDMGAISEQEFEKIKSKYLELL